MTHAIRIEETFGPKQGLSEHSMGAIKEFLCAIV